MRSLKFFSSLVILVAIISSANAQESSLGNDATQQYEKILEHFNSSNYEAYSSYVADNIECYTGVLTPLRFSGKKNWMNIVNGLKDFKYVNYDLRDASFWAFGDNVVVINGSLVFTTTTSDGLTARQSGRQSTVLIKSDGQWKIANNHFSSLF